MKLFWKIGDAPTGRYRSFEKRSWPMAFFDKEKTIVAAFIDHPDSYTAQLAKAEDIGEIKIRVAHPEGNSFNWVVLKKRAKNVTEAKKIVSDFFDQHPDYIRV